MKRTIVLIRHAKSDWSSGVMTDFDRPLNDRGMRDAPVMGQRLVKNNIKPDLIISSMAKRAATTARLIARELNYNEQQIAWVDKLYHCSPAVFDEVLSEMSVTKQAKTIFVVAHNPGITEYANEKVKGLSIDNMPTCSMVAFNIETDNWQQFSNLTGTFQFFDYPKNQ